MGKGNELEEEGGEEREREKGRLGSPEGRRPATRYRKRRWNFACHVPSTFARKATMFEPPLKKTKNAGKIAKKKPTMTEPSNVISTTSPRQCNFWHQAQRNDLGQTALVQGWPNNCEKSTENATKLTTHNSHQCPKSSKNTPKSWQNRQIDVQMLQKSQKTWKNDNLISKIDQQRVLCFRNLSARKVFAFT